MSGTSQAIVQNRNVEEIRDRAARPSSTVSERKQELDRKQKRRSIRQTIIGTGFLGLVATGWVYPVVGYFIPLCMLLGIGIALFRGRTWCNWLCPRGSFADGLLKRVSSGKKIPEVFRSLPMRVGTLTFLMVMLGFQIVRLWPDVYAIGGFFVMLLTITTGVGILLALLVHHRTWCYICPIGTMSNWVGANRRPLKMEAENCVECKLCAKVCPMKLKPYELKDTERMSHGGDCLKCGLCGQACPYVALSFKG